MILNIKASRRTFFILLLIIISPIMVRSQETKSLSLEDLIPGGKTYQKFIPHTKYEIKWFGDKYVLYDKDTMFIKDPAGKEKEKILLTKEDLKDIVKDDKAELTSVDFVKSGGKFIGEIKTAGQDGSEDCFFDPVGKVLLWKSRIGSNWNNIDLCIKNKRYAYTFGNNLYLSEGANDSVPLSKEKNRGIVYGQAVHRNEFGIEKGTFWSPAGNYLAFYRMDESMVTDYPLVDITARTAAVKNIKYPMAGMKSHEVTVGIYDLKTRSTVYLKTGLPKEKYLTNLSWSPDEKYLYIFELNRDQDTCKLVKYDISNGNRLEVLFTETHPKYVEPMVPLWFLNGSTDRFIWQSRNKGYNHLFLYNTKGKILKQLTSGKWEVYSFLGLDPENKYIYILTNKDNPIEFQTYRIDMNNLKMEKLTSAAGDHHPILSASCHYLLDTYSSNTIPRKIDLIDTKNGKTTGLLSAGNPFEGYDMPEVTFGSIKAADGATDLYYKLVKPPHFNPGKKYPTVVYVYGGPHLQTVVDSWGASKRGWDLYMARKGYVIFTLDNRGTPNRGLSFENITFRKLGINETADQMEGVKFLKSLPYVDSTRIGVHGWSFGGFMTLNLMLRHPEVFKAGVAGGPVIDWYHYEIMYGERYMDSPQKNPEGYEETDLKKLAGNLKGRLLIIHGTMDPTVVWQHSLSFLQACVKAGTYPDYFVYPGHEHNVMGHDRVHLHEKITRYFEDYLK